MSIAFRLANMTPKFFNTLFVIYGSGTSSWKPWRWERLNLIFTIKDRSWSKIDRDFVTFLPYLPLGLIQCTILRLSQIAPVRIFLHFRKRTRSWGYLVLLQLTSMWCGNFWSYPNEVTSLTVNISWTTVASSLIFCMCVERRLNNTNMWVFKVVSVKCD